MQEKITLTYLSQYTHYVECLLCAKSGHSIVTISALELLRDEAVRITEWAYEYHISEGCIEMHFGDRS